jgi:TonB-dependent starch-binding outer membrane protein SusC
MKLTKLFIFCVSSLLFSIYGNAQDITIKGKVADEKGMPISGASILINGTKTSTSTDFDGTYSIKAPSDGSLVASFIGLKPETVAINGKTTINFNLSAESQILNTVVVVAYGSQKRTKVTGAISTVSSKDIAAVPITNAESALQGRAAGVTVVNNGAPGTSPTVIIRGLGTLNNNTPLYVIDGTIVGNLSGVSPNDIENISVLKDASTAALYGSQAYNGVVVVTTKKGKKGKGQLSFTTYTGAQTVAKRYDLLNTAQYLQYANSFPKINVNARGDLFGNGNTNWQDQIFQTGIMRDYNLSFSGGTETSSNRYSAGYLNQEGALIGTDFERYTFRSNNSQTFGKFSLGSSIGVNFSKRHPERISGDRTLLEHAIKSAPYLPVYNFANIGGYQDSASADEQDAENPVKVQKLGEVAINQLSIIGNIYGEYEIVKGLKFRTQVGLDYFNGDTNSFIPSYGGGSHVQPFSESTRDRFFSQTIIFDNSLNYKKTIAEKHNIDAIVLIEKYNNKIATTGITSRYNTSDEIDQLNLGGAQRLESSNRFTNKLSYVARVNYDYDEKYLLSASARRDGSSRFGANNRWGNFYSLGLGWNIAKEAFLKDSAFSTLKLRGSIGTTGNDLIPDYQDVSSLGLNFVYPIAGASAGGVTLGPAPNPNLKWEEKLSKNIGLDFGLFNEKITGSVEYFNNTAKDILFNVPLGLSLGTLTGSQIQNIAAVDSHGFEVSLGYNDTKGDFTWSANINVGSSKNKVVALAPGAIEVIGGPIPRAGLERLSRLTVGDPLFYMYGYATDGIYQNRAEVDAVLNALKPIDPAKPNDPRALLNNSDNTLNSKGEITPGVKVGDVRFKDLNGDGQITSADKAKIGNQFPDFNFGLNLTAAYKNFDFNCFISGVKGNDIFNASLYELEGMTRVFNASTAVLGRTIVDSSNPAAPFVTNPAARLPRLKGNDQNTAVSDRYIEDGSYARLKNIALGYTIKNTSFDKYFSKFRVYASAQNLITLTKYSGLDPESGASGLASGNNGAGAAATGIDQGYYPQPKSIIFGLEVSF